MKKFSFVFIVVLIFLISCHSNKKQVSGQGEGYFIGQAKIEFSRLDIDFGTIQQGEEIMIPFNLKNTGDAPLIIYKVEPSCGCTVSQYPDKPIKPGETAQVKLIFNSDGYSGYQIKTAKVFTNTKDSIITLTIHGVVNITN